MEDVAYPSQLFQDTRLKVFIVVLEFQGVDCGLVGSCCRSIQGLKHARKAHARFERVAHFLPNFGPWLALASIFYWMSADPSKWNRLVCALRWGVYGGG
jgi:hypothetical protein